VLHKSVSVLEVQILTKSWHRFLKGALQSPLPTFSVRKRPASAFTFDADVENRVVDFVLVCFVLGQKGVDTEKLPDEEPDRCFFEDENVAVLRAGVR
jgi:hypothetical protein